MTVRALDAPVSRPHRPHRPHRPQRGRPWRFVLVVLQLVIGAASVAAAGWALRTWMPQKKPPPGWRIIRPPHDVLALALVGDEVWAGGPEGLVAIDAASGAVKREIKANRPLVHVAALEVAGGEAGEAWVGHRDGLSRYDGVRWETVVDVPELRDAQVWAVRRTREALWAGTERGAVALSNSSARVWTTKDGLAADAVTVIFDDSRGRIWLGNGLTPMGGLSMLEGGTMRAFTVADSLAHAMVNAIAEDRDGRIWVGTGFGSRGGASRYDGNGWTTWRKRDGLAGDKVRSLLVDRAGGIWFGAEYDGVARFNRSEWWYVGASTGLAGNEVKAMVQDQDGNLWLGTEDGVSRCSGGVIPQ